MKIYSENDDVIFNFNNIRKIKCEGPILAFYFLEQEMGHRIMCESEEVAKELLKRMALCKDDVFMMAHEVFEIKRANEEHTVRFIEK